MKLFYSVFHKSYLLIKPFLLLLVVCTTEALSQTSDHWSPIGPGGGGHYTVSAISPNDPSLLFSASDMYGAYRSADSGNTWKMISFNWVRYPAVAPHNSPSAFVFHSTSNHPNRIYASSDAGFVQSDDSGVSWAPVKNSANDQPWTQWSQYYEVFPRAFCFNNDISATSTGVAFFNPINQSTGTQVAYTLDNGTTWLKGGKLGSGTDNGKLINAVFVDSSTVVVATVNKIYSGAASGNSWKSIGDLPLNDHEVLDFAGDGKILYATISLKSTSSDQALHGKLYYSTNHGVNWVPAQTTGIATGSDGTLPSLTTVATCAQNTQVVYITADAIIDNVTANHAMVYRSNNGGQSWFPVMRFQSAGAGLQYYFTSNHSWLDGLWGWNKPFSTLAVSATNSAVVMTTNITSAYLSTNVSSAGLSGGTTWREIHAPAIAKTGDAQPSGGMQIMSCWNYYFSENDPEYQFAAMTDFGGWWTSDGAKTWNLNPAPSKFPATNIYALAIDPSVSGKIWAATSDTHDIPIWDYNQKSPPYHGTVCISTDAGKSWRTAGNMSLPDNPVTDIWLDRNSLVTKRVLWVAVYGSGVYKTTDGAETWTSMSQGIDTTHQNVLRVVGDAHGTLYALTTDGVKHGGLYKLNGSVWQQLFPNNETPSSGRLTTFTIDPNDSNTLYVAAIQSKGQTTGLYKDQIGGAWRSTDGGSSWKPVATTACYAISIDSSSSSLGTRSPHLFASSWANLGSGLYECNDGGDSQQWTAVSGYPFSRPLKVVLNPEDSKSIIVTGFGGAIYRRDPQ